MTWPLQAHKNQKFYDSIRHNGVKINTIKGTEESYFESL